MTIPVAVWCPDMSRDRTYRFVPLADARVRGDGAPGLTDSPSLRQRGRSRADWNRRFIGCNDAYGGLVPAPPRFPEFVRRSQNRSPPRTPADFRQDSSF